MLYCLNHYAEVDIERASHMPETGHLPNAQPHSVSALLPFTWFICFILAESSEMNQLSFLSKEFSALALQVWFQET